MKKADLIAARDAATDPVQKAILRGAINLIEKYEMRLTRIATIAQQDIVKQRRNGDT